MRVLFLLIGLGLSYLSEAQTYTLQEIEALTVQNYPLVILQS